MVSEGGGGRPGEGAADGAPARAWGGDGASDGFALRREAVAREAGGQGGALVLEGSTERAVLHAAYELLGDLGARFPVGRAPELSGLARARLDHVEPRASQPAFSRRAFASDIMTWHYEMPDRLSQHLEHDAEFIAWMAARGINAFSFSRHPQDTRLKIDELVPRYRERGIVSEYGGHVLSSLLPRERFDTNPDYFPVGAEGTRSARGNLCVSNRAARELVAESALRYVRDNPECGLLHIWGADVRSGAWCQCAACRTLTPQPQYATAVNAIAERLLKECDGGPPVAYLAYHDTLEPDPQLRPLPNVWFEWAPRERCYSHAIDDPSCKTNPRYFESLRKYIDLFDGRGHVFEYYADAILFGGLAFATPSVIARDLRAYRALGLKSISCLTFGAYSVLAYPVNLETYVRATRSPDFEPDQMLADTAAALHPQCSSEFAQAYRAIAHVSALILNRGGDVMRPSLRPESAHMRPGELAAAMRHIEHAVEAADHVIASVHDSLATAECAVWKYSRDVVSGIADYVAAGQEHGAECARRGEAALKKIGEALRHIAAVNNSAKGTWGAYDLERFLENRLQRMRSRLDSGSA